jgi:hypothetical protein
LVLRDLDIAAAASFFVDRALAVSETRTVSALSPKEKTLQIELVAGARNQRYLHLDHAIL